MQQRVALSTNPQRRLEMKTSVVSEGREEAIATHTALRMETSQAVTLGHFYQRLLDQNIWVSQAALAAGLGVSPGHVSKALQAARIPAQVICALGGADRVTFRIGDAVHTLIGLIGETAVLAN